MSTPFSDDSLFQYSEWPFYWLTRVADRYVQRLEVALKAIGLDVPRWRVLMQLKGNSRVSVSDIAEHAIAKLPTMTKIIQRMATEGLVVCLARESDARVTEVMLTAQGRAAKRKAWAQADRIYRDAFVDMEQAQIEALTQALNHLFANLAPQSKTVASKKKASPAGTQGKHRRHSTS